MEKINILYCIDTLEGVGGTEKHLLCLIKGLNKEKFNCVVCNFNEKEGPIVAEIKKVGFPVYTMPLKILYGLKSLKQGFKLRKILKENHVYIMQSFHFKSDTFAAIVAKISGVPIIISSRRDLGDLKPNLHLLLNRFVNIFVDRFITVSDAVKKRISRKEGISPKKITTLYNGVDLSKFNGIYLATKNSIKTSFNISNTDIVVGYVANFRPEKGYDTFIKAIPLITQTNSNIVFIAVGDGPLFGFYKQLAKELGVSSRVIFTGYRNDIRELLSIMDIFCICSSSTEGFSNAILEAMAMQKPIIATKVGGNSEAIINEKNGFLIPPNDPAKLAEALLKLCDNPDLMVRIGKESRRRVIENFSLEGMIRKTEDLYIELAGKKIRYL
jgi:glycosyltransferase involved in cell wall biosynthesis